MVGSCKCSRKFNSRRGLMVHSNHCNGSYRYMNNNPSFPARSCSTTQCDSELFEISDSFPDTDSTNNHSETFSQEDLWHV